MIRQDPTRKTQARPVEIRTGENRAEPLTQHPTRAAKDATGVNLEQRGPIDSRMPHLPPA